MVRHNHLHKSINYNDAREIGILYNGTNDKHTGIIKSYVAQLKKDGKQVDVLGLNKNKKKELNQDQVFPEITRKHINWIMIPDTELVAPFINKKYDLLLNLSLESLIPLEYISALSNAKCRVGRFSDNKTYCYDFMVELDEGKDLNFYIKQIDHYLNIIHDQE